MIIIRSIIISTIIILLYNNNNKHVVDGAQIFHRNFATIFHEPSIHFTVKQSPVDLMVDLTNQLSYKLLHLHSFSNVNNFAFSPCALGSVLIALYEGSYGRCSLQIHDAVQLPWDHDIIRIGYRDIHRKLRRYFYKEENLLAGLILNEDHITIRLEYENVLRFYGYDLTNGLTNDDRDDMNKTEPAEEIENIPSMTTIDIDEDDEKISTIVPEIISSTTTKRIPTITTKMTQKPTISPIKRPSTMTTRTPPPTTTTTSTEKITTTPITTTTPTTPEIATELMVDETTIISTEKPTSTTIINSTPKAITTPITTTTTTTTSRPITTTSLPTTYTNPPTTPRTTMYIYTFKPISNTTPIPKTTTTTNQLPTTDLPDSTISDANENDGDDDDDYDDTTPSTFITTTTTTNPIITTGSFQTQPPRLPQRTLNPKNNLYPQTPSRIVRTKRDYSHFIPPPPPLPPNFIHDIFDIPLKYHHSLDRETGTSSFVRGSPNHENILSLPFPFVNDFSIHQINDGKLGNSEFHPEETLVNSPGSLQQPPPPPPPSSSASAPFASSSSSSSTLNFDLNDDENFNLADIFLNQEYQSKNNNRNISAANNNNNNNNNDNNDNDVNNNSDSDNYNMGLFHINQFEYIRVPYKFYNTILRYSELPTLKASALEIPLDTDDYSLLLLIPHPESDLNELLVDLKESATAPSLRTIKENFHPQWIQAAIPNFKLNGNIVLTEDLMKMGIVDIFEPTRADFRIMTDQSGIYTKHVEQKININLRTHANNQLRRYANIFQRPIKIAVNRPFLFFIIDTELNLAIMSGKILNPINSRII